MDSLALLLVQSASADISATALVRDDHGFRVLWSKNTTVTAPEQAYADNLARAYDEFKGPTELRARLVSIVFPYVAEKLTARRIVLQTAFNSHAPPFKSLKFNNDAKRTMMDAFKCDTIGEAVEFAKWIINSSEDMDLLTTCGAMLATIHDLQPDILHEDLTRTAGLVGAYHTAISDIVSVRNVMASPIRFELVCFECCCCMVIWSRLTLKKIQPPNLHWISVSKHPQDVLNAYYGRRMRPLRVPGGKAKETRCQKKVHAETNLAHHLLSLYGNSIKDVIIELGTSKLSCFPCLSYIAAISATSRVKIVMTSSHGKTYSGWTLPDGTSDDVCERFMENLELGLEEAHYFLAERSRDSTPPESRNEAPDFSGLAVVKDYYMKN